MNQNPQNPQDAPTQLPVYYQPTPNPQPPQAPMPPEQPKGSSAMGVVSVVLGIIALLTSLIPIINNFSALLAIIGIVFGIIGMVKKRCSGKGLSVAGLILNVIAIILVFASQSVYSTAVNEALSTDSPSKVTIANSSSSASNDASSPDASSSSASNLSASNSNSVSEAQSFEDLPIGSAVELKNGLSISVDSVESGLVNYDGGEITCVTVTYKNDSSSTESFNVYEWKGQDAQGAQYSWAYYSEAVNELNSGKLAPGGTVTGNIYFDGVLVKVVYDQIISFNDETISWAVA